jgi:hypothetical protein
MTTIETLRNQLAKAEAAQADAAREQHETINRAQHAWAERTHANAKAIEDRLEADGQTHYQAATEAARDGDLTTAYKEFIAWHSTRAARYRVRVQAQGAAARLGLPAHNNANLSALDVDFQGFLAQAVEHARAAAGEAAEEELIGYIPTDYDTATDYLKEHDA